MSIRVFLAAALCTPLLTTASSGNGTPPPNPPADNKTLPDCGAHVQPQRNKHESRMERIALSMLMRQLILDKYDTNDDGILDDNERQQLLADAGKVHREAQKRFIIQFDRNKDGKLDADEQAELKKALSRQHKRDHRRGRGMNTPPGGPPPPGAGRSRPGPPPSPALYMLAQQLLLEQFDTNANGKLDPGEFDNVRQEAQTILAAHKTKLLNRFDSNHDGTLDKKELDTAKQTLWQEREVHREMDDANNQPDEIDLFLDTRYDMDILLSLSLPVARPDLKLSIHVRLSDTAAQG